MAGMVEQVRASGVDLTRRGGTRAVPHHATEANASIQDFRVNGINAPFRDKLHIDTGSKRACRVPSAKATNPAE